MIIRVTNDEGKPCYAIELGEHFAFEDVLLIQKAIIWAVRASASGEFFDAIKNDIAMLMELLEATLPTPNQMCQCEKHLFPKSR